jgi:predicted acetyltransferase
VTWKPRQIEPQEIDAVVNLSAVMFAYGPSFPDPYPEMLKLMAEVDRIFVIDDGPTLAGTAGAFTMEVAVPGGNDIPMCGVTEVGVLPTHRRRGMLTSLMATILDQAIERGEPVAGLTASEGGIYRRFGYGVAARTQRITVNSARSAEVVDPSSPGLLRLITEGEAETLLPEAWAKHWRRRPGEIDRNTGYWKALALDPEPDRHGAGPRFIVVHEDTDGQVDGAAIYRVKEGGAVDGIYGELLVEDIIAVDDRIEATLLRYLLDVDLIGHIQWRAAPLDLALRWRLRDSRQVLVTREHDHLWLRPLDVPACLTARTYAAEGSAVLEVLDDYRPELGGTFRLDTGPDGSECGRATGDPDVVLQTAELGALMLGGVTWATLHRAGLLEERTPGTLDRLDAAFRPDRAPFCGTGF